VWYNLAMKRREFLKVLGVVPAIPLVVNLIPEPTTRVLASTNWIPEKSTLRRSGPEMTATEVESRMVEYRDLRAEFIRGFEKHQLMLQSVIDMDIVHPPLIL